ncbi:hypothetical protein pb186bvf_007239 [Paramecium bursaria]
MLIFPNKTKQTIGEIKKMGSQQYLFFDIEEAPKYYEMLEHYISYNNYSGRYKYYIFQNNKIIRLDYLLEAIRINSDLIKHIKLDLDELEKQIQSEQDFIIRLKLSDKNNNPIYPSLEKEQKQIRIMFTQFTKDIKLFKLIQQKIVWPQFRKQAKKNKQNNKNEMPQINSYCLRNLYFYRRQATQLNKKLHNYKKGIHKQLITFFDSVDPRLFDYYLIKFRIPLINDVSALINEINAIIDSSAIISNDIKNQALNDVKYTILQRLNNYVVQLISHLNLNHSFQVVFRNKLFEYLLPKINQQILDLIEDKYQVALLKKEHDNFKKLILQYLTDFIQQI